MECLRALQALSAGTRIVTTVSVLAEVFAVLPCTERTVEAVRTLIFSIPIKLAYIEDSELERAFELMNKYADLPMDFADAEVLVIAERIGIKTVFTLDRRDFSIYRPRHVRRLRIIP